MNVLSIVERLAGDKRAAVQLDPERCLHASDAQSACAACLNLCPVGAISLATPPTLDPTKCVGCLACLPVCPVGAYTAADAVVGLLECAAHARMSSYELICERHPHNGLGLAGETLGLRVPGCLAGLGAGAYVALATQGATRIIARTDACATCAWRSLAERVDDQVAQARQLLAHSGRAGAVTCLAAFDEAPQPRPVIDTHNPPRSRRDLFRTLTHQGQLALARAWSAGEPRGRERAPGRDRKRMAKALAHMSSEAMPNQPGQVAHVQNGTGVGAHMLPLAAFGTALPHGLAFAILAITDECNACEACVRACPTTALQMEHAAEARFALKLRPAACIGCEVCVHVCAPGAIRMDHTPTFEQVFGVVEPVTLAVGALTQCEHCGVLMAARPVERFCGVCADRRDHPFGSRLPPGFRGNLQQPAVRP